MRILSSLASKLIMSAVAVGTIALAVIFLPPSPAPAKPAIAREPDARTETILAGDSITIPVSFTASKNLSNVNVRVVPELAPYVQTNPTFFSSIAKGEMVNLDVTIAAPADALPTTVEGTIQLRNAGRPPRNFARPFPVTVDLRDGQRVTKKEGGYSVRVPRDWEVIVGVIARSAIALFPPDKSRNPDEEYNGDIFIRSMPNPDNLSLRELYQPPHQTS